jgi:hypothetical protein
MTVESRSVLCRSNYSLQVVELASDSEKNLNGIKKIAVKWREEADKKAELTKRDRRVSAIF